MKSMFLNESVWHIAKLKRASGFLVAVLLLSLLLMSCQTIVYYGQAAAGQWYIFSHRENIEKLIKAESTEPQLKAKLMTILEIRAFAEQELHLPLGKNYASYVNLQRPYVVWNVFASPEFSMEPVNWCYPIAGCVSYRGYFSEDKARAFAAQFKGKETESYDTYVGGVAAYSTLGWFSDPVLNTLIGREDYKLASLIFHELAHQLLYIPGDTQFNESFATAVEREGLKRWLEFSKLEDAQSLFARVERDSQYQEEFVALVRNTVEALKSLYATELAETEMRKAKQRLFGQLQGDYKDLKHSWDGYSGYDGWFSKTLNNAQLGTVTTYFNWVPAFEEILQEEQSDLLAFYDKVKALEALDISARQAILSAKAERGRL